MLGVDWGPSAKAGTALSESKKIEQSRDRDEERLRPGCIILHVPVKVNQRGPVKLACRPIPRECVIRAHPRRTIEVQWMSSPDST
jgi:hypothetical protein